MSRSERVAYYLLAAFVAGGIVSGVLLAVTLP